MEISLQTERLARKACTTFAARAERVDLRVAGREGDGNPGEERKRKVNSDPDPVPDNRPTAGKILIDIQSVGLHEVRSRLGIIPQDPTMFEETLRSNLEPLEEHTDEDIWQVFSSLSLSLSLSLPCF